MQGHKACASPSRHHTLSQAPRGLFVLALCEACPQPSLVLSPLLTSKPESCATGKQNLGSIGVLCWSRAQVLGRVGAGAFTLSTVSEMLNDRLYKLKGRIISTWLLRGRKCLVCHHGCLDTLRVWGCSSAGCSAETQAAIKHLPSAGYSSAVCIHPGTERPEIRIKMDCVSQRKKNSSVWKMYGEKFLANTLAISM